MDPREVEMISIVNMQEVPEEIKKEIQDIESGVKLPPSELKKLKIVEDETVQEQEDEDDDDADEILQPGKKIKPEITEAQALKLAERLYGIVAKDITELNSYDDRNFLIHHDRSVYKNADIILFQKLISCDRKSNFFFFVFLSITICFTSLDYKFNSEPYACT